MATFTKGDAVVTAHGATADFLERRGYVRVGPAPHVRTPRPRVKPAPVADPGQLKGKALDAALEAAGLPTTGKADEKRDRLAEHLVENVAWVGERGPQLVDVPPGSPLITTVPSQDQHEPINDAPEEQS